MSRAMGMTIFRFEGWFNGFESHLWSVALLDIRPNDEKRRVPDADRNCLALNA